MLCLMSAMIKGQTAYAVSGQNMYELDVDWR